jgi:heme-degrading monooxygenase HmoA
MFVQVFTGWRYHPGVRDSLAARGKGDAVRPAPTPDVPGLIARLLATDTTDPDTGIGVWVWENEAACRAYEAARSPEVTARLATELDESAMIERTFDALAFGCRIPPA